MQTFLSSGLLQQAILSATTVNTSIIGPDSSNKFTVVWPASATQAQITQGNTIAATWSPTNYQTRTLPALVSALQALTTTQQGEIATDLFTGSPLKVLTDTGINAAAIGVLFFITQIASLPAASINLAKLYAAAMYVQDNPTYLVNPSFDTSINVPGYSTNGS